MATVNGEYLRPPKRHWIAACAAMTAHKDLGEIKVWVGLKWSQNMENDTHAKDLIKIALIENQNGSPGHQPTVGPLRQVGAFRRVRG